MGCEYISHFRGIEILGRAVISKLLTQSLRFLPFGAHASYNLIPLRVVGTHEYEGRFVM